jgi:hypothetical protein
MEAEKIELKFEQTNFLTRWPCTICGGHTEKDSILVEAKTSEGTIRACWLCLRGDNADGKGHTIDERLAWHITAQRECLDHLQSLRGRLKVPTYDQWLAACEEDEARAIVEYGFSLEEARIQAAQYAASLRGRGKLVPTSTEGDPFPF